MSYQNLIVETRDGVAVVTINRPDKLNALNDRTMEELDAAFAALGRRRRGARRDPHRRRREGVRGRAPTSRELATQSPVDGKERSLRGQRCSTASSAWASP